MTPVLWDTHIHLDFFHDPLEAAREAEALELGMLAVTTAPGDYERIEPILRDTPNVRTAVGLHPWWAADGRCGPEDAARAAKLIRDCRFVGEIGLDASPKHVPVGSLQVQCEVFELLCAASAEPFEPGQSRILSIHSVKAAGLTLDILERTGCLESCHCIFHWFTGSNEELTRAVKSGCMFSVNNMMLSTRRGREYARQIPADRLLAETDLPPGRDVRFPVPDIAASLEETLSRLQDIRGTDMRAVILENTERLLGS